jgi:hypothetical protein
VILHNLLTNTNAAYEEEWIDKSEFEESDDDEGMNEPLGQRVGQNGERRDELMEYLMGGMELDTDSSS